MTVSFRLRRLAFAALAALVGLAAPANAATPWMHYFLSVRI